jgi:outer membrane protein assembly factor BamA
LSSQYRLTYRRVVVDENTLKIQPLLIPLLSQSVRVGLFSAALLREHRDDPLNATRGSYTTIDTGVATRGLGSQTSYSRVLARSSSYHRLTRDLVFARMVTFGWLDNRRDEAIPLPERFYGGGAVSHRGFPENQAGPRDVTTGFPLGGQALLVNQLELRFPLLGENVAGVLFHDAGNVYSEISNISFRVRQRNTEDFDYMVHAVGLGLRYRTPVGPIRIDLAFGANTPRFEGFRGSREDLLFRCRNGGVNTPECPRTLQRISQFQFHFSLGQAF